VAGETGIGEGPPLLNAAIAVIVAGVAVMGFVENFYH
jgi:hypothetical protein